ncbi:hypothetical protein CEUSTIGMA_g8475.t1 [Chlamydomonas eustigma]|uniref:SGNH hydrolase-type esterase domain-containing protein n=1 Tax=Chlamydomonas eustigma TaxID=1157962 RepID=A0A250XE40_9CHLO|nr:hypothetical protein CEUSTIGMA_g8475.t1 [Chlamydomonas eustigma]|eukprot:GAX81040.1 hypothetical protein CEUSTIGMA_g8475.t1 [Chlamydomonas eustigma]
MGLHGPAWACMGLLANVSCQLSIPVCWNLQTEQYETTQENIFRLYLPNQSYTYDLIVVNTGFHDLQVCDEVEYGRSVQHYFNQISTYAKAHGSTVMFVSLTRVMENKVPQEWKNATSNKRVQMFNAKARTACQALNLHFIDMYSLSRMVPDSLFSDAIHIGNVLNIYYTWASRLIWMTYEMLLTEP